MNIAIPATVHAALVILFSWLVHLAFLAIGIDLGNEAAEAIAQQIVAYILSLGGLALLKAGVRRPGAVGPFDEYHPPFT